MAIIARAVAIAVCDYRFPADYANTDIRTLQTPRSCCSGTTDVQVTYNPGNGPTPRIYVGLALNQFHYPLGTTSHR